MQSLNEIGMPVDFRIIEESDWKQRCETHLLRASAYTHGPRQRRDRGEKHPVEDFLFEYYPYSIATIEQWHPGLDTALRYLDVENLPIQFQSQKHTIQDEICFLDISNMKQKEAERLRWISGLLQATQQHPPNFTCHGIHEWAMVYQAEEIRHASITPLRLTQSEVDAVVESHPIACSHHDAFRFFAKAAKPMNKLQPSLATRHQNEQPGCVHANMDLYKWAAKCMPWIGSELLFTSFSLARQLRLLDMQASPYDLSAWKIEPIKIETSEGRRTYEKEQKRLAEKAGTIRSRLINSLNEILEKHAQAFQTSDSLPA
ncbi:MAG: 3-methyladenine DNA glycosylase [Akkermansiaceae bacterium]